MMPALQNPAVEPPSGFVSPFRYVAELSRPFVSILKGIHWEGFLGSTDGSTDPIVKETKRVAYQIRQTLGIKGFVLNLAGSSALSAGLPACWDAVRPCLETPELEDATAQIWVEAFRLAEDLGDTNCRVLLRLSREQTSQLQVGLDLYRFLLPKMLVLTSALRLACDKELVRRGIVGTGGPEKALVREDGLHELFQSIRGILSIAREQGAVAMSRAWAEYLAVASAQLRPLVQGENYHRASDRLYEISRQSAPGFQEQIGTLELNGIEAIARHVTRLETRLPSLIMSITLLELYRRPVDSLHPTRPTPARSIPVARRRMAGQPGIDRPPGRLSPAWVIKTSSQSPA